MALLTSVLVLTISIQLQIPLYILFPLPTISSEKKGPELMVFFFFPNEHLKSFGVQLK